MQSFAKTTLVSFLFFSIGLSAFAQKKELTDSQYFKNDFTGIINPLPTITKWIDDSHVLLSNKGKNYILDCKTGQQSET